MPEIPVLMCAYGVEIDAAAYCIRRDGQVLPLRRQTMQVLRLLMDARDRIVTKDELIAQVWDGLAVTDDVLSQCIAEIRKAAGDDRRAPRFIRTVPKVGYQFIAPLQTSGTAEAAVGEAEVTTTSLTEVEEIRSVSMDIETDTRRWPLWLAGTAVAVLAAVAITWHWRVPAVAGTASAGVPGKRSVLILPLTNQSGRPDLSWLRAGVAEMLITDLARSPDLAIADQGQISAALRRHGLAEADAIPVDRALAIGRDAGAETIVLGGFLSVGSSLRVDLQIYDVDSRRLVSAEHVNVTDLERLFQEIDTLSLRLIEHFGASMGASVRGRDAAHVLTSNIEAYRAYALGVQQANSLHQAAAIDQFRRAIGIDPDFAMAYARIGYTEVMSINAASDARLFLAEALKRSARLTPLDRDQILAWSAVANDDFSGAISLYSSIVQKDPDNPEPYWRLGHLLAGEERFDEAVRTFDRGLQADPHSPDLLNDLCVVLTDIERYADAIAACARAVGVMPAEANVEDSLGLAYQAAGDDERAIEAFTRAITLDPTFDPAYAHRGNVYFREGRYRLAAAAYENYLKHTGDWTIARGDEALAWIAFRQGSVARARDYVERARQRAAGALGGLSESILIASGDLEPIRRLDVDPLHVALGRGARVSPRLDCFAAGLAALAVGRSEDALRWLRQLQTHRPVTWFLEPLDDGFANALAQLGRLDEAIGEYRRLIERMPAYPRLHYELAIALERRGAADDARREYAAFLSGWPLADRDAPEIVAATQRVQAH